MYYEEKVIDGVLHFRNLPDGEWKEMSKERLTEKVEQVKNDRSTYRCKYFEIVEALEDWMPNEILNAITGN